MWASRFNGTSNGIDKATDIVLDASNNVIICGTTWNGTNYDYLVIKYDNNGAQQWSQSFNGSGNGLDEPRAVAVDASGRVYVTGWSLGANYEIRTICYDAAGVQQWSMAYNGNANSTDESYDIAIDGLGDVIVVGSSIRTGTGEDYITIKYNNAGVQQWATPYTFTGNNTDKGQALFIDNTNSIFVTGYSGNGTNFDVATVKYNPAGTQQWVSRYNGPGNNFDAGTSIVGDNVTGKIYVAGYSRNASVVDYDYVTLIIPPAGGAPSDTARYGGNMADNDRANAISIDAAGNAYVTGKVINGGSNQDMVTIKYDNSLNQQWIRTYNSNNNWDEGTSIFADALGYVYVSGFSFTAGTDNDYLLKKLDAATGNYIWLKKYNNSPINKADKSYGMVLDAQGNIYMTGYSYNGTGTVDDALTIKYCQLTASVSADTAICLNASVQLNSSAQGAISYSWTPNVGLSSDVIANPVASPLSTTTYVVTITNANGCTDQDTVVVTVYPLPGPAITPSGPTSFCQGGQVTLTSDPFNSYLWNTTATTQSITVNQSGTYSVNVTDTNTCAAQSQITVTVFPLPNANAGNDTSICLSQTVQLNASGGNTYTWQPGNTLSDSTIANPQAGMTQTTTYTVVVTDLNGCVNTDSITVTIVGNPPVPSLTYNFDTLCSSTATSYQWYMVPSILIPGETGQCFVPDSNGTYYVVVSNSNGCTTASQQYSVNNIGYAETNMLSMISIYPNPNVGLFTFETTLTHSSPLTIQLMNITGDMVSTINLGNMSGQVKQEFDFTSLAKGVYFMRINTSDGFMVRKIVINQINIRHFHRIRMMWAL